MAILEALASVFGAAVHGIADLAAKVWNAIRSVYVFASTVFDLVGTAWDWMINGLGWLGDNIVGLAARVWHLVEHVALVIIPNAVRWALGHAIKWAAAAVAEAKHLLNVAINEARRFLHGLINELRSWAVTAFHFVLGLAHAAGHWISTAGAFLWRVVSRPERLVQWILGALVLPLLRFLIEASAPILALLFRAFRREAVAFAHTLEDVLHRLL